MDLNTVTEVVSPAGVQHWRPGDAWLAGGTALFGQPQPPHVLRLLDLVAAGWPPLTVRSDGLEIAATCTVAELYEFTGAPHFEAFHGIARGCCSAFLASFKIWNVATVGGNLCAALPAGPMIALTAALDGVCRIQGPKGDREVSVAEFVTGDGSTVLADGELLRAVHLPAAALTGVSTYRQGSLHPHGRSAALLIGRRDPDGGLVLTVTGATQRPHRLVFPTPPTTETLQVALAEGIPETGYVDDVHGLPAWRRHLTRTYAEEIRAELCG